MFPSETATFFQSEYLEQADPACLRDLLQLWAEAGAVRQLFILLAESERGHLPALQAFCCEQGIALYGAIFPALVRRSGFAAQGMVVVAFATPLACLMLENLGLADSGNLSELPGLVGETKGAQKPGLFLMLDGMLPNIGSILNDCYEILGHRVTYAGVNAGSETFQPLPCIFDNTRCLQGGGLAVRLPDGIKTVVRHDYPVAQHLFRATSSLNNSIAEIDGRPAMTVYQELLEREFGVRLTQENFYELAVHFPFGLVTALEVLVRIPVGFSPDGSLHCVGEIPPNAILRLLHAPSLNVSQGVANLAADLGSGRGPMLSFYCAGRRMHHGEDAARELLALAEACATEQVFGALTLGEIGCDAELGMPLFHNAALVCLRGQS